MSRTNDIVWALQQQQQHQQHPGIGGLRFSGSGGNRRQVNLTVLRGFPDSEKPWLPRLTLEPSPTATVLTPPSSAVESPASEDDDEASVPSPVLSAPGLKTFSGRGTSGNNTLGFAGSYGGVGGNSAATAVNYSPEEPPPSAATASSTTPRVPDNIAVNTPMAPSPEAVLSAPGRKTFSGGGGGGAAGQSSKSGSSRGFGFSAPDDEQEPAPPTLTQQQRRQRAFLSTTATTVELGKSRGGSSSSSSHALSLAVATPPSPDETKGDEDSGEWGDSNGSADSTGGGRALKVPAPTQANVNAGGDPAVPFATFRGGGRATPSREGQGRGQGMPSLGLGVGSALAACWGVQETNDNDENSRPTEFDLSNSEEVEVEERIVVRKPPPVLVAMSRGTSATSSTVGGAGDYGEYDESFGDDTRSAAGSSGSGSSRDSSLCLTAVSPSRVPPPLVSVASSGTLPPVSMASSVVSGGSFSNPWLSPTPNQQQQQQADSAEPPLGDSMSWLQPLPPPPPPPRKDEGAKAENPWEPLSSGAATAAAAGRRGGMGLAYPSGRWVQTPQTGEILEEQPRAEPKDGGEV